MGNLLRITPQLPTLSSCKSGQAAGWRLSGCRREHGTLAALPPQPSIGDDVGCQILIRFPILRTGMHRSYIGLRDLIPITKCRMESMKNQNLGFRDIIPIIKSQMENMEMQTGFVWEFMGIT